uniref:Protein tweety homolog n=1 Tax=Lepisosteus oculatus TaxID=7918 RepID=W5LZR1_LEPOC
SLLFILAFLIRYCCCRRDGEEAESEGSQEAESEGSGLGSAKGRGLCCVTWVSVAAVIVCCMAIGIGFYGNSEANDGIYQVTYSLATANHTLASIKFLVSSQSECKTQKNYK